MRASQKGFTEGSEENEDSYLFGCGSPSFPSFPSFTSVSLSSDCPANPAIFRVSRIAFGVRTRPCVALAHGPSIIRISTSADVPAPESFYRRQQRKRRLVISAGSRPQALSSFPSFASVSLCSSIFTDGQ